MVKQVQYILVDDIDGGPAEETVSFALDAVAYEIDLSAENAAALRDAFAPYVGAATKTNRRETGRTQKRAAKAASNDAPAPADVRAWARSEGIEVSPRGRVSADIVARYIAATS